MEHAADFARGLSIGIIMDGNGRWAKKRGLPRTAGHKRGAEVFQDITRYCNELGVASVYFYAFSTENWRRPAEEVGAIMRLFGDYLIKAFDYEKENNRVVFLGDRTALSAEYQRKMNEIETRTARNTGMVLNVAVNYGGRQEIARAARLLAEEVRQGTLQPEQITEQLLKLEREGSLSKTEYAVLYRRSMDRSAVIRHCYDEFVKDHDLATLRKNLQLYLRVLEALRSPSAQISNPQHAAIIEELQRTEALSEAELRWVIDEYCEGSEVVVNSFDVCVESKDVAGLASMLRKLMKMVESYQLRDEAKSFFETLFREMVESGVVSVAQSEILFELLQESSPVLVDLYGEYLRSQDFEGLLGALIVLCTLGGRREEGENDDGAQEGELEMEPWKISEEEIDRVLEEIGEKDLGMRRVAEELLDREDEEGISAVGLGEELDS